MEWIDLMERRVSCQGRYMHAVNLCEVDDDFLRVTNEAEAEKMVDNVDLLSIDVRRDMDDEFSKQVARIKSNGRISIADCVALTLTRTLDALLLTSDHHKTDLYSRVTKCFIFLEIRD